MNRPPIKVMLYGLPQTQKSKTASTFPKPMLVLMADDKAKANFPYFKGREVSEIKEWDIGASGEPLMLEYQDATGPDGIIRVEYYHDSPAMWVEDKTDAAIKLHNRFKMLPHELKSWKTIVVDSITFHGLNFRKYHELVMNPLPAGKTKATIRKGDGVEPRSWYGGETDDIEDYFVRRMRGFSCNVVVIGHESVDKTEMGGEFVKNVAVRGRLSKESTLLATFAEVYHAYHEPTSGQFLLQTKPRDGYVAGSGIGAPDPCWPDYESLWAEWDAAAGGV